jgi:hypothetical protein
VEDCDCGGGGDSGWAAALDLGVASDGGVSAAVAGIGLGDLVDVGVFAVGAGVGEKVRGGDWSVTEGECFFFVTDQSPITIF